MHLAATALLKARNHAKYAPPSPEASTHPHLLQHCLSQVTPQGCEKEVGTRGSPCPGEPGTAQLTAA